MESPKVLDGEALAALRELQEPGAPDIVLEVVRMFLDDSAQCRQAAERALAAGDASALAFAAHRLRGSAALLGLNRLQQTADDLERVANLGGPTEWAARLHRMQEALVEAHDALSAASLVRADNAPDRTVPSARRL
jgi:HPt (histidine-containing phosphotransfer) domain-containing protein